MDYFTWVKQIKQSQFQNARNTLVTRQDLIKKEGSEFFTWIPASIAATVTSQIEVVLQFPRARKYAPLDFCEVANNDVVDITVIINGGETLPVPAGVIRQVKKYINQIGIRNDDAAIATTLNKIIVSLRREPQTADDWARKQP